MNEHLLPRRFLAPTAPEFIFLLVKENEPKERHPGLAPCGSSIRKDHACRPGRAHRPSWPEGAMTRVPAGLVSRHAPPHRGMTRKEPGTRNDSVTAAPPSPFYVIPGATRDPRAGGSKRSPNAMKWNPGPWASTNVSSRITLALHPGYACLYPCDLPVMGFDGDTQGLKPGAVSEWS